MASPFVDKVTITVRAGDGGNGAVTFHREKYVAAGGPDGGDGGRGGDIIFEVDDNMSTLMDFRYKRKYVAANGADGQGKRCSGRVGQSLHIRVPRGTLLRDADSGAIMHDMSSGEPFVAARGHERLARGHVVHDRAAVRVAQQGAARHADVQALAHAAGAALALTVGAVGGHVFALVAKIHERGHVVIHFKDDVAAAPAVTAVRPAGSHVFLAVEGHRAVAAVARAHGDGHFINKWRSHGHSSLSLPGSPAGDKKNGAGAMPTPFAITVRSPRKQRPACDPCPCARTSRRRPRGRRACRPYPCRR